MTSTPEYNSFASRAQLAMEDVFGRTYSFQSGIANETVINDYYKERMQQLKKGQPTWIVRSFESGSHDCDGSRIESLAADYYSSTKTILGTIILDTVTSTANAYRANDDGTYLPKPLCRDAPIEAAVTSIARLAIYQPSNLN